MKFRTLYASLILVAFVGAWFLLHEARVAAQSRGAAAQAPIFEVDPYWPKPLPNHWVLGSTIGLSVDAQDHVWIIHRPATVEDNFKAADFIHRLACAVRLRRPFWNSMLQETSSAHGAARCTGLRMARKQHGYHRRLQSNVWIGGNGNTDTQILKFDKKASFIFQIGKQGTHNGSNDLLNFWRPAEDL
jgi:hypothetical protein